MGPKRLLLIDDNVDIATVFSLMLNRRGYYVTPAYSIDEALDHCQSTKFNLVICDIKFPNKSGYHFLKVFRETCDAPVLAISASVLKEERQAAIEAGFDGFVAKPILIEHLTAAIEGALAEASARALRKLLGNG